MFIGNGVVCTVGPLDSCLLSNNVIILGRKWKLDHIAVRLPILASWHNIIDIFMSALPWYDDTYLESA